MLVLKLQGDTSSMRISVNNTVITTTTNQNPVLNLSVGILQNGNNSLKLEKLSGGTIYFDYYEVEYTRNLSTASGKLQFIRRQFN